MSLASSRWAEGDPTRRDAGWQESLAIGRAHRRSASHPDAAVGSGRDGPAGGQGGRRRRALRGGAGPSPAAPASAPSSFRSWSPARASYIAARRPDEAEKWLAQARELLRRLGLDRGCGAQPRRGPGSPGRWIARRPPARRSSGAIRGWEDRGRAWEAVGARLDLAQCLIRMNRHVEAADVLEQANARAQEMGSPPLVARADEIAKPSRGRGREQGAVAAADRARVRGGAADRGRHDERARSPPSCPSRPRR